jgi:tol-pal system protein YbgF
MTRFALCLVLLLCAGAAHAQETNPALMDRFDRMERDLQLLQRQLARGEPVASPAALSEQDVAANGGPAELSVRLSQMEEEMRALRGKVEEVEFQNRRNAENFEKFQRDVELRFSELKPGAASPAQADASPAPTPDAPAERKPIGGNDEAAAKPAAEAEPATAHSGEGFATPREHYNHAFRLLNQTKYDEAAKSFGEFTKQYPKDPLVGNAYYWQGETYYIRRDYVAAADHFRQGFEVLPNGPKAPDNLLKLAMSLNALQRDKEACVVLGQVVAKFKKNSASVAEKAAQEQKRIGC